MEYMIEKIIAFILLFGLSSMILVCILVMINDMRRK